MIATKTEKLELLSDTEYKEKQGVIPAEYARMRGMTRQNVSKHIKNGIITLLPNGNIDPEAADKELADKLDPSFAKGDEGSDSLLAQASRSAPANGTNNDANDRTFHKVKTFEKKYQAKSAKLAYEKEVGMLVNAKEVRDAAFSLARKVRDQMLGIPDRVAALIAAEKDKKKVHETLVEEIEKALQGI